MAEIFKCFDVLVTTGQVAAPRLDAYDSLSFWTRPNPFSPSNVARGPAASVCNGFSSSGMPFGMQIIGRPFDDAAVICVGHAYQQATHWHMQRPALVPGAVQPKIIQVEVPDASDADAKTRTLCDQMAERAGLKLSDQQRVSLYRAAPYALKMAGNLRKDHSFSDMPANVFRFPRSLQSWSD